jgi:uncharacterized protein (TIGR02217 family)
MNDFLEVSFPSDISYGSTGGTEYLTSVLVTSDGQEQRYSKWQKPRRRYNVIHGDKKLGRKRPSFQKRDSCLYLLSTLSISFS